MNLQLDSNHSIFANAPEVQEYFKEFAKGENLSYFQFARFNHDGSMLGLLNRVDLFRIF